MSRVERPYKPDGIQVEYYLFLGDVGAEVEELLLVVLEEEDPAFGEGLDEQADSVYLGEVGEGESSEVVASQDGDKERGFHYRFII
jgi:hypothetical protein